MVNVSGGRLYATLQDERCLKAKSQAIKSAYADAHKRREEKAIEKPDKSLSDILALIGHLAPEAPDSEAGKPGLGRETISCSPL